MSTTSVQGLSSWERGAAGEDLFESEMSACGLTKRENGGFAWLRNVAYDAWRDWPELFEMRERPKGDLDFICFGTSGLWLWDVKHWHRFHDMDWCEQRARATQRQASWLYARLEPVLRELDLHVNVGWVMTGWPAQQQYIEGVPAATPAEAIEMMRDSPKVLTLDEAWDLGGYARRRLADNGRLPTG